MPQMPKSPDPHAPARQFAQNQSAAARQESGQAQNALMTMFRTEAQRQAPWANHPLDMAKLNARHNNSMQRTTHQYDLANRNNANSAQRRYGAQQQNAQNKQAAKLSGDATQFGANMSMRLAKDLNIPIEVASGFFGNFAAETGDFRYHQEINPLVKGSRGGAGWAQWTGPRRVAYEQFAQQNNLPIGSPEHNYNFLVHELQNTGEGKVLNQLQNAQTPEEAAAIIGQHFERPANLGASLGKRQQRAREIYQKAILYRDKQFAKDSQKDGSNEEDSGILLPDGTRVQL